MFTPTIAVLLAALALLLAGVSLGLIVRRGRTRSAGELGERLDRLVAAQESLPRALAEGTADQARSLYDVRERLGQLQEATRRLEDLGRAVSDVQQLLQVPHLRGSLGEAWLEELLRQVLPADAYTLQHGFRSGERVDAVIRLGDRLVPVDAKFPLDACRRMLDADGEARDRERRAFRRAVRARVDEIAEKYIRPDEGTFDFALMYVPAERVYYEAVMGDTEGEGEGVAGYARERRIMLVSPNTFYAYLSSILHGLRGLRVEARAGEILDALGGLAVDMEKLQETIGLTGRHLQNAMRQQEDAERRAAALAGRIRTLAGGPGRDGETARD